MTILIELLLIGVVGFAVGYPIFIKKPRVMAQKNISSNGIPHLLAQKEVAYATLKDLDFDFETGKLSDEDYKELKQKYEKEAIGILEMIDRLSKKKAQSTGKKQKNKDKNIKQKKRSV